MTVENTISKTGKQIMGAKTYDFSFDILLKDPTTEAAEKAIKCTVSDGTTEKTLIYGRDYSVSLNSNRKGGRVTVVDPKNSSWTIVIYRSYDATQEADYNDFDGLTAERFEQCLDKVTMVLQDHQEQLDRTVKVSKFSTTDPKEVTAQVERIYSSIENVDAVANNAANINTVVGNLGDIQTTVKNLGAILDAPEQAAAAANSSQQSKVWDEGTDTQVQALGGTHSAKVWAGIAAQAASGATFGVKVETIALSDWVFDSALGLYKIIYNDALVVLGVYKGGQLVNINIGYSASGATLYSDEPFAGTLMKADSTELSIHELVEQAQTYANNAASNALIAVQKASEVENNASIVVQKSSEVESNTLTTVQKAQIATIKASESSTSEINANNSATIAHTQATNAQNWASQTDGKINNIDYSAKAWAIGGIGTENNNAKYWAERSAQGQIQADWIQKDVSQKDYIKNKPIVPNKYVFSNPLLEPVNGRIIWTINNAFETSNIVTNVRNSLGEQIIADITITNNTIIIEIPATSTVLENTFILTIYE